MSTATESKSKEAMQMLEAGIEHLTSSEEYARYLDTMAQFHGYSMNNTIMIYLQRPNATFVAGYKAWREKFNRQVRKGEKAITILAPCFVKGHEVDKDGNKTEVMKVGYYRTAKVFDISQTDGEELPSICSELKGDVTAYDSLIGAIEAVASVPISFEAIPDANGYYSSAEGKIAIRAGMSQQQTVKTMVHELAHSILHGNECTTPREQKEAEAESVAYVVCRMLGIDTSDYSIGYIAGWQKDKDAFKSSMTLIHKTANTIYSGIKKFLPDT